MSWVRVLGLLIPVLAKQVEQACHGETCEEGSTLMQLNGFQGEKLKATDEGVPWWVWKKILEESDHPETTTTTTPKYPCDESEPQSPRNVSDGFQGELKPRVKPVGLDEFEHLIHVNTHFHLGGEHCNVAEGGYSMNASDAFENPDEIIPNDIRPGYFCAGVKDDPGHPYTLDPFHFQHCENVFVGYTYEFHWVHSTAGPLSEILSGGLGGVFARSINPTAFVRGQICRIVNDPHGTQPYEKFNETWREPVTNAMHYVGSTTGTSYDNYKCSPAEVTWLVDRDCCTLSAQNLDRLCHDLLTFGKDMEGDVKPAPSRLLVAPFISDSQATILNSTEP